jgi:hypothetical protein
MKTLIIQKIDGHEIVAGLGKLRIEPIRTRSALREAVNETAEYKFHSQLKIRHKNQLAAQWNIVHKKRLVLIGKKLSGKLEEALKATPEYKNYTRIKAGADLKTDAGIQKVAAAWQAVKAREQEIVRQNSNVNAQLFETDEYKAFLELRQRTQAELKQAWKAILKKQKSMLATEAIYFEPKAGEELISDEEAETLKASLEALPEKTFLLKTGKEIIDRRRDIYFFYAQNKWTQAAVEKLGEELPEPAVFQADLTDEIRQTIAEENEAARLEELSQEEKQAEFDAFTPGILRGAVFKRQELEIEGLAAAKALKQAQAWREERLSELKVKYNITA